MHTAFNIFKFLHFQGIKVQEQDPAKQGKVVLGPIPSTSPGLNHNNLLILTKDVIVSEPNVITFLPSL